MFSKSVSFARAMGCCDCFGFTARPKQMSRPNCRSNFKISREFLLDEEIEEEEDDDYSYYSEVTNTAHRDEAESIGRAKRSEEILRFKLDNGLICRQFPVKETNRIVRSEVSLEMNYYISIVVNYYDI